MEAYDLPPKLYQSHKDSSRTIIDVSFADDVLDWKKYEFELSAGSNIGKHNKGFSPMEIETSSGHVYNCWLPAKSVDQNINLKAGKFVEEVDKWSEALMPLRKKTLTFKSGWWTYEFCFNKHIKQFHQYKNEKNEDSSLLEEYLLGRYVPGRSTEKLDPSGSKFIQEYVDGDICSLATSNAEVSRTIQVHFRCESSSLTDYIENVIELGTCMYIMTIATPRVCRLASRQAPKTLIRCTSKENLQNVDAFHQQPTDSEQHVPETDKEDHRKQQQKVIKDVASSTEFPSFSKLVNELVNDFLDEVWNAVDGNDGNDEDEDEEGESEADDEEKEESGEEIGAKEGDEQDEINSEQDETKEFSKPDL